MLISKSCSLFWIAAAATAFVGDAAMVNWIDWETCTSTGGRVPTTCTGTINTATKSIGVTYTNNQGISFYQNGSGTDYFTQNNPKTRDISKSPFISSEVSNIPPPAEMIALRYAGSQTLTFSEPVQDLFFAYISLNRNGYGFDQDFTILTGNGSCGYWGCGSTSKVIDAGPPPEYQLHGSGEPHGVIVFRDSFSTLTWKSLANEHWNGMTIGITTSVAEAVKGDPHFKTWSKEKYDYHGVCDLVLLQNPGYKNGLGMNIHLRTEKTRVWSYVSAVAVQIGNDTLEVRGGSDENRYWINGVRDNTDLAISGNPIQFRQLTQNAKEFLIDLGSNDAIVIRSWNNFVSVDIEGGNSKDFGESVGLMGTYGEGRKVARDRVTVIDDVNAFGQEWQVLPEEPKLFHNIEGPQAPKKCEIPSASQLRRRLSESIITKEDAKVACSRVGPEDFDLCVFDVMATNDKGAAGAY